MFWLIFGLGFGFTYFYLLAKTDNPVVSFAMGILWLPYWVIEVGKGVVTFHRRVRQGNKS